jgi:23S rRNA (guanosine2251-2'-O)-methyltransferase
MSEWIVGRNPVYETLRAGRRRAFRLTLADGVRGNEKIDGIEKTCRDRRLPVERVRRDVLDGYGSNHQGIALEVGEYPYRSLDDIIGLATARGEPIFVLILDTLQDPQNLGTLLRTAEAVGVHGVIIPTNNAAKVTPAVVSASAGASEHLLVAQANLVAAMQTLKEQGAWLIGLDAGDDSQPAEMVNLGGAIGLVVGSEGQGMRRLVRATCDVQMRLPMVGRVASLNAAIAGSVALYRILQARRA